MWLLPPVVQWKWLRKKERWGHVWDHMSRSIEAAAEYLSFALLLARHLSPYWRGVEAAPLVPRAEHTFLPLTLSLSLSNYNFMPSFTAITNTTKLHLLPPQVCEIETSPWIVFSTYLTCIYSYKNRNDKQRTFSILEFYWFFIGFYGVRIESSSVFKTILPSHFHYSFIYL